jgi:hypothetical protein
MTTQGEGPDAEPESAAPRPELIFKDVDKAFEQLVDAWRNLNAANATVSERERANAERGRQHRFSVRDRGAPFTDEELREQGLLGPFVAAAERARTHYEVVFAIYQEAARARDAESANRLAESNNAVAATNASVSKWIAGITFILALAAVAQTAATIVETDHTWKQGGEQHGP